jgi:hypothetical protein
MDNIIVIVNCTQLEMWTIIKAVKNCDFLDLSFCCFRIHAKLEEVTASSRHADSTGIFIFIFNVLKQIAARLLFALVGENTIFLLLHKIYA